MYKYAIEEDARLLLKAFSSTEYGRLTMIFSQKMSRFKAPVDGTTELEDRVVH